MVQLWRGRQLQQATHVAVQLRRVLHGLHELRVPAGARVRRRRRQEQRALALVVGGVEGQRALEQFCALLQPAREMHGAMRCGRAKQGKEVQSMAKRYRDTVSRNKINARHSRGSSSTLNNIAAAS